MMLRHVRACDRQLLDVGCGTGSFALRALAAFPQLQVTGLDLSAGMLQQAGPRCYAAGKRLRLVQGDSERLPFADNSFDVITCCHSFHHYPHQQRVVAEMHRVLRPGGCLIIVDGDRDRPWGRLIFDGLVVWVEGAVRHLSGAAFRDVYHACGFADVQQERRGGPLPFLLTAGRAVKSTSNPAMRQAA